MKEGTEEKDIMEVVYCRGFKKLLKVTNCTKEKCEFHLGILEEPIKQRGDDGIVRVIDTIRHVRCGFPRSEKIFSVCEVED